MNDTTKSLNKIFAMSPISASRFSLSIMVGIPIVAMILFSSVLILDKRDVVLEMDGLHNASPLISLTSNLIHELQKERGYTSGFIASRGSSFKAELLKQRTFTDKQYSLLLRNYLSVKRNAIPAGIIKNLDLAIVEMGRLKDIRVVVDSLGIAYLDVLKYYAKTNSLMLDAIAFAPELSTNKLISNLYQVDYFLQEITEREGLHRAHLLYAFKLGKFQPGQHERFLGIVGSESYFHMRFLSLSPPEIMRVYLKVSSMREVREADRMKQVAIAKGTMGNFGVDAAYWNEMQTKKIDGIKDVCDLLDNRIREIVNEHQAGARNSLIIYVLINLLIVILCLLMGTILFRNIVKRREAEKNLLIYAKRMKNALHRTNDVLNLIATSPEIIPFFTVSPVYRSVQSIGGGDIVKWVRFRSQYASLYMHDVAGHDIEEILLNILATSLVDTCKARPEKKSASAPSVFLYRMNEQLAKYCEGRPDYLTAIYLLMDFEEREIKIAAAGHPRPWLIALDGSVRQLNLPAGLIVGQFDISNVSDDHHWMDTTFRLETGQLLLIYSDGLMEQKDAGGTTFEAKFVKEIGPKLAGMEPLTAYEIVKRGFETHLNGLPSKDDVSFVFVGTRPAYKYETIRFVAAPELLSLISNHKNSRESYEAPLAKAYSAKSLSQTTGKPDCTFIHKLSDSYEPIIELLKNAHWADKRIRQIELAISEMIINAIMHGNMCCDQCTVELSYILHTDELEVCVTDEGAGFDSKTLPQSLEDNLLKEGGRGHHMINAMADGLYFNEAGNRCWALFEKKQLSSV